MSPETGGEPAEGSRRKRVTRTHVERPSARPTSRSSGGSGSAGEKRKGPPSDIDAARKVGPHREAPPVPVETLIRRVSDARRMGMVAFAFRAALGVLATAIIAYVASWVLALVLRLEGTFETVLTTLLVVAFTAAFLLSARLATLRSMPQAAAALPFLADRAFVWVDPFRDERPRLLPLWIEMILWAPSQFWAGWSPLGRTRAASPADVQAAAAVAHAVCVEGELDVSKSPPDQDVQKGLRLLLLLRLARLMIEEGDLKVRISGLGQAALFEGTVG